MQQAENKVCRILGRRTSFSDVRDHMLEAMDNLPTEVRPSWTDMIVQTHRGRHKGAEEWVTGLHPGTGAGAEPSSFTQSLPLATHGRERHSTSYFAPDAADTALHAQFARARAYQRGSLP